MEELVSIEQFLLSVPDDLRVWLRERKPESLHKAATLADDYVLARKTSSRPAPPSRNSPGVVNRTCVCIRETVIVI